MATQDYKSHTRFDPVFHFFLAPGGMLFLIYCIRQARQEADWYEAAACLGLGIWLMVFLVTMRLYSMKVQDRVIRLEERTRLKELLPETLKARIPELTIDQLIGLRFASDAELPSLVEKALAGNWNRKQIKEAVQNWRADDWRV